jgi:hypothetical protein
LCHHTPLGVRIPGYPFRGVENVSLRP